MSQELVVPEAVVRPDEAGSRRYLAQTGVLGPAPEQSRSQGRGPTTLFQVRFASAMSDPDIARLAGTLDLTMHMRPNANDLGAVRLDHHSGLFLARGEAKGQWVLEARTWGHPDPQSVHDWHVLAAGAARLLDPDVVLPERLTVASPEYPLRPVGRAANKRSARIGRRILGI
jgi:hypothetical protein